MVEQLPGTIAPARNPATLNEGECRVAEAIWGILREFGRIAPEIVPTPQETTPTQQTTVSSCTTNNPVRKV